MSTIIMRSTMTTSLIIAILASLLVGGGAGVGATHALTHDSGSAPEAVAAVAPVVEAANAEHVTDAETRAAIATMPAVNIAVEAAVRPQAEPSTVALAAYLGCIAGAQGKAEGSAAFGCQQRGQTLDATLEP